MGALAPVASWTSDDDLLLKNAIETGTSLESLGKGGVQFSRKFTFQELKDRWLFLTSHANVSVEASPDIAEFLDSPSALSPKPHILADKVEKSVQRKRLNESLPDCYNPMLKRVKSSIVENGDNPHLTDHGEANQDHINCVTSNCESVHQNMPNLETVNASTANATNVSISCNSIEAFEENSYFVAKEVVTPSGMLNLELNDVRWCKTEIPVKSDQMSISNAESDFSSSMFPQIPIWNTSQSIFETALPEGVQVEGQDRNAVNSADFSTDAMDRIPCHNKEILAPSTDEHVVGSSASCLDLSGLEEFLFTDIDGKDIDNIPDLDSFLSDFAWDVNVAKVEQSSLLGGGTSPGNFVKDEQHLICSSEAPFLPSISAAHPGLPTCFPDAHMLPSPPDANDPEQISCAPEAPLSPPVPAENSELPISCVPNAQILPSIPNVDHDLPGLCNGIVCCVLNTEDTEIPCNDDALIKPSSRPPSSSSRKNCQVRGPKTTNRAENMEKPSPPRDTIQSQILSDLGINLPFISRG
ncbi:uncharacterized protein LOC108217698 [Daucus carota subsp. sativus]|uniref:uncharacterized protein LOC108217698 n=1 Tax=Daucus carota subsp. sativus TaxID=79200 RepID=UPI0007EEF98D|nr:PREDICTED: uncharacterized protein LOC108217698 [Daucus carota subsp. sativus]